MDFEIIQSNKGKPKLCYHGYLYNIKNKQASRITWSCVKRLTKCPGTAKTNLEMENDHLSFSARFNGVAEDIYCPTRSVLAIYARENGEGMMFPQEEASDDQESDATPDEKPSKGPSLKVIK